MADIVIKVKTEGGEESLKNINDLKNAISSLEEDASKMDLGSEAFENSKNQIDELKKKLESLSKSQNKLDEEIGKSAEEAASKRAERMERVGNNLQKFAAGLTDAFAGAFIAMGASEKDAAKLNATLQQGVGIALGVKGGIEAIVAGVELAGPAFEAFNAIIAANPIGAVVIAVAALVAGIYLLTKALNAEESESEKLTKQLEKQKAAADLLKAANANETTILEAKIGLMKAQGASSAEILKAENDLYEAKRKGLEQDLVQLKLAANVTKAKLVEVLANESLTESYFKTAAALARSLGQEKEARIYEFAAKQEKLNNSKEVTEQLQKDLTAIAELKTELTVLDLKQKTTEAAANAAANAAAKETKEENKKDKEEEFRLKKEKLEQELKDGDAAAEYLGELEKLKAEEKQYWIDYEKEQIDAANAAKLNQSLEYYEAEKKAKEKYEQELYDGIIKFGSIISENFTKLNSASGDLAAGITINLTDAFKTIANESATDLEKVTAGLNAINGMLAAVNQYQNQVAEENVKKNQDALDTQVTALNDARDLELEKEGTTAEQKKAINYKYAMQEYELKKQEYDKNTVIKKKAFEQDKNLKIATTVISTITGAMSAFSSLAGIAIVGPALGALAAAAVVAMGAVQVAAIRKQKFDAGSPPAAPKLTLPSTSDVGGGRGGGAQQGPELYRAGQGDINTGQGGPNGQRQGQPQKVYVVSQEVTSSQNMNAVLERRSSF